MLVPRQVAQWPVLAETSDRHTHQPLVESAERIVIHGQVLGDTAASDRDAAVQDLRDGAVQVVFTVDVFNEGVDVPEANVAVVLSGSASVREHVQRLGRVLRAREGKRALLYELVTAGTTETSTSARRRDHSAYR